MVSLSTLCYIEQDGKYLMLHRTVKKNDVNKDKWIGVGGHFEYGESPEDCVLREVKEETGINKIIDILYLNWIFKYNSLGVECTEYAYIIFVKKEKITLNEENIDYKWCDIKEFIEKIKWYGDKEELYNVLKEALDKKLYFKIEKIEKF